MKKKHKVRAFIFLSIVGGFIIYFWNPFAVEPVKPEPARQTVVPKRNYPIDETIIITKSAGEVFQIPEGYDCNWAVFGDHTPFILTYNGGPEKNGGEDSIPALKDVTRLHWVKKTYTNELESVSFRLPPDTTETSGRIKLKIVRPY